MHSEPTHVQAATVRPATSADFSAIAELLIQLYAAELPGALSGPRAAQGRLLEWTLAAKNNQGVRGRFVACDEAGAVVGTGTVEYSGAPRYERAPNGTIRQATEQIGYRATARLLLVVAQSMIGPSHTLAEGAAWFHSVVVDARWRGRGVGKALVGALERQALEHRCSIASLQVLAMNQPARRLYGQLGYTEVWSSPRWQRALTWPSSVMRKTLLPNR